MTINSDRTKNNRVKKKTEKEDSPVKIIDNRTTSDDDLKTLFPTLEGRMLVIKVGDKDNHMSDDKLKQVEENANALLDQFGIKCLIFVTNHFVDVSVI